VTHYLDTSAALKLVVEEPESMALAAFLNDIVDAGDELVSSMLRTRFTWPPPYVWTARR
jgi:hypothetical protein